jgi:hypothetical protein
MAEKILKLYMYGVGTELGHIQDGDSVTLESSDPTDEDPIEWVNVHVTSSSSPVWSETRDYDAASENEPGPMYTERAMEPNAEGGPAAEAEKEEEVPLDELTVAELKDELRAEGLPVSGTKDELIERLEKADYNEWTVEELKDALRSRGLMVSGTKAELVERLEGNDLLLDEEE